MSFGGNMMIFLAGLQGINPALYEAADIEGANAWQKFKSITWPQLSKTTFLVSTQLIIGAFQVFDQAYMLTKADLEIPQSPLFTIFIIKDLVD